MKFKLPKFGGSKRADGDTLLLHFVRKNVCKYKAPVGDLILPLTPAFLMIDITQPASFFAIWAVVLLIFVVLWQIVPCNRNLNCNNKRQKDGTKALLVAFLITYGILFGVAVMARVFICTDSKHHQSILDKEGGFFTNIISLFKVGKIDVNERKRLPRVVEKSLNSFRNSGVSQPQNKVFPSFKLFHPN
jgi:hypothetical protein